MINRKLAQLDSSKTPAPDIDPNTIGFNVTPPTTVPQTTRDPD